jgi:ferric iron reductase protein FhuF
VKWTLNRKILGISLFFIIYLFAFSEIVQNPLENYVSNEVYASGNEKFSDGKGIFERKIVDRQDVKKRNTCCKREDTQQLSRCEACEQEKQ